MQDTPNSDPARPNHLGPEADSLRDAVNAAASPETLMQEAAGRIAGLEADLAEAREKWLRAEAEIQNVRTRARKDADDARAYGVQKFAREMVEIAETLERALASIPPQMDGEPELATKLRDGVSATGRAFQAALERNGVARHEAQGQPFNPDLHQAMAEAPSTEHPAGTVAQAWTPAWTLNGRLLKPAMVVVATGGSAAPAQPAGPGAPAGGTLDTSA